MRRPPVRRALGEAPPERTPGRPPAARPATAVPNSARPQRPVGKPPNPRTPALVRDVKGGRLGDLFGMFPDLPRPRRPVPRLRGRVKPR